MRFSIVTICYNQASFLRECIESVLSQDYPDLEYIVVDPGSTDGSREIIEEYSDGISRTILEPDDGPADGLNKGFNRATGDIYGFLNADDRLLPGAVAKAARGLRSRPWVDVLSGHGYVVNREGRRMRKFFSDVFCPEALALQACCLFQQGTFFRADAFHAAGGFNPEAEACWDGELWIDMYDSGARFARLNEFLAEFRVYPESISGRGDTARIREESRRRRFRKVFGRQRERLDWLLRVAYLCRKYALSPWSLSERLLRGSIFYGCAPRLCR